MIPNGLGARAVAIGLLASCWLLPTSSAGAVAPTGKARPTDAVPALPRLVDVSAQTEQRLGQGVSYFVIPHPDDELSAWSAVQRAAFPVFVLLTQGEASSRCPKLDASPASCKRARVDSWNTFLDGYFERGEPIVGDGYSGYLSASSARLVFDLGDRALSEATVTTAIDKARVVGSQLGPEEYVVASSIRYGHPDHEAVYRAVRAYTTLARIAVSGTPRAFSNVTFRVTGLGVLAACPGGTIDNAYHWLGDACWKVSNNLADVYRIANPQLLVNLDLLQLAPAIRPSPTG